MIIAAIIAKRNTGNQFLGCDMESPGRIDSFPQAPGTALHPDAPGTAGRASVPSPAFLHSGCLHLGPGHNAECPVRYHFTSALPGFSCQLRAAEKDNAFFPVEESIRLYPVRKIRRHRQQPWPTQLDLLNLPKEMRIAVKFQIRCKVFQQQKDLRPRPYFGTGKNRSCVCFKRCTVSTQSFLTQMFQSAFVLP